MFALMPWRRESAPAGPLALREEMPFRMLRRELGSLFDRVFGDWPEAFVAEPMMRGLEVEDREKEVVVRAEAPGFEVADFEINLANEVLTIRAEHKEEKAKEGEAPTERRYAGMRRSVLLPPGIETEKVEATYRNGMLEVHLPRSPEALGRRIEVRP